MITVFAVNAVQGNGEMKMTKFEEEFKALTSWDWVNVDLIQQILTRFGNWHSDEEFQKLKEEYSNQADSILLMLEEIGSLKSQFQQQALPVVPDYVGNAVMKINLEHLFTGYTNGINEKAKNWLERHKGVKSLGYYVCQLRFQGFTVEKPQLFKLIFPNSTAVLQKDGKLNSFVARVYKKYLIENAMTEQEIKSIDERYWQFAVPVEDGE